jgi:hypothetical protein
MKRTIRVVPIEQAGGAVPRKNFRGSPFIRNTPEYDIILKLGSIKAYDDNRRILGSDGKYIPGSDITMLMNEAMTPKRTLIGLDEFVKLLHQTKVDPDIIMNDNIRSKLVKYKRQNTHSEEDSVSIPQAKIHSSTNNTRNQPRITLDRINVSDYNHLLGRGRPIITTRTKRKD